MHVQGINNARRSLEGCLLGTAVGDAIGLPYEGLSRNRAQRLLGPPDKHRFYFGRGMISDDTDHACMILESLLLSGGIPERFQSTLAYKLRWWLASFPAGVGLATLKSILRLWVGFSPSTSGVYSAGNGPAMRSPVIGVAIDDWTHAQQLIEISSKITHSDRKATHGALTVALAARVAKSQNEITASKFHSQLLQNIDNIDDEFRDLMNLLIASIEQQQSTMEFADSLGLQEGITGYIYHTVPTVIHCWLTHQNDFKNAIVNIIKCGGDTDTTAAILGGIVGARTGSEGIPEEWVNGIREWPMSIDKMHSLIECMEDNHDDSYRAPLYISRILRNLMFLSIVMFHGVRRLLPPYAH